jgi:hypothetical protein
METELADYIFNYCSQFYNDKERKAIEHHFGTVKKFDRFTDDSPEFLVKIKNRFLTDDSDVLELLKDGYANFIMKTAERIYRDHKNELEFNSCPKCNGIARTPKAKQCRFCGHDWH